MRETFALRKHRAANRGVIDFSSADLILENALDIFAPPSQGPPLREAATHRLHGRSDTNAMQNLPTRRQGVTMMCFLITASLDVYRYFPDG
ncbi:MAG: hypothetical protein KA292_10775, partial [Sphingorhabdus sp.]|nr:hypothetical protein [Sphingorhabdus sp.]